jgi:4-hydroxy-2-oxoheptanedioate aldolase
VRNRLRELLDEGRPAYGVSINIPDPVAVELVGLAGFDYAFIDLEHSGIDLPRLETLLRTALGAGLGTVVRTPGPHSELTARIVDLGVDCVLVPRVASQNDVYEAVATVRFPPLGQRGIAEASRTADYGAHRAQGTAAETNRTQVLGVMIETAGAVSDIEHIVKTDGLDFVFIGPEDLAASMGHIGERGHPDVQAAVQLVIDTAHRFGMKFAMGAGHPAVSVSTEQLVERGVSLVLSGRDSNLLLEALRGVRERGGSGAHL